MWFCLVLNFLMKFFWEDFSSVDKGVMKDVKLMRGFNRQSYKFEKVKGIKFLI